MSEQELIQRFVQGKRSAFEELYTRYSPELFAICLRYARNSTDAEDFMHDVFVKIYDKRTSFNTAHQRFMPWARTVAVNHIINALRTKVRFVEKETEQLPEVEQIEANEEDDILEHLSDPEAVISLIQSMPEGYRTVFNLYVFEEKKHGEIAVLLGISEGSSKSQLHRARLFLQQQLQRIQPETNLKAS